MSRFKINIHQMQEESAVFKEKYDQYKMDQDSLYKIALTADGSWNDDNTPTFIDCVEKDSKSMDKFHDSIYKCMETVSNFSLKLDKLLSDNDVEEVQKNLTYDEDFCKSSIKLLENCVDELKSAKSKIDNNSVGCKASRLIQEVRANIVSSINELDKIENNMSNIRKGVEELITTASTSIKSAENVKIIDNELKYNWEPVSYVKDHTEIFKQRRESDSTAIEKELDVHEVTQEKISSSSTLQANSKSLNSTGTDAVIDKTADYASNRKDLESKTTTVSTASVDDVISSETHFENSETVVSESSTSDYNVTENGMNTLSQDVNTVSREEYNTTSADLIVETETSVDTRESDYEINNNTLINSNNINISNKEAEEYSSEGTHLNNSAANISLSVSKEDYSANTGTVSASSSVGNIGSLKPEAFEIPAGGLQNSNNMSLNMERPEYDVEETRMHE